MHKRSSNKKKLDLNELANEIVEETVDPEATAKKEADKEKPKDEGKNPAAVALGRLGGLKGGKARAKKLTPEQRREIARKAALVRWKNVSDEKPKD